MEVEGFIELPAEANPLTEGILYQVLRNASSSNQQLIQTGTKQLQRWETERGYHSLLQALFIDKSLPVEVRYLAVIQLKNGIDRYWRKTASNAISKDEKAAIRPRLLESGVNEADTRLALQNALVTAKIIRYDYPNDWPDVMQQLISLLRSSSSPDTGSRLHLSRALLILLQITKELSTGRLLSTRAKLHSITPETVKVLGEMYLERMARWQNTLRQGGDDEAGAMDDIEVSLIAIRIIRRLLISGYEFPHRNMEVQELWKLLSNQLSPLLQLLSNKGWADGVKRTIEKHILQIAKLHHTMAQTHPASFALAPDCISLTQSYWSLIADYSKIYSAASKNDEDDVPYQERIVLRGLLILRACIKMVFSPAQTFKYRHPEEKEEQAQATKLIKDQLFSDTLVLEIMETLVTRYFVIRQQDVEEMNEQPEEWEQKAIEGSEGYEFSVRASAEKLFMDLSIHFKRSTINWLTNVIKSYLVPQNMDIRTKEAVYSACSLAAPSLVDHVDFDEMLATTIAADIARREEGIYVLRRRIAIVIATWVPIRCSTQSKAVIYDIFEHLLDSNQAQLNPLCVLLAAGRELKNVVVDWEFQVELFMPHAKSIIGRLMNLISATEMPETKKELLDTMSVIVESLEHNVAPFADDIVSLSSKIWMQLGAEYLIKQNILTILIHLVNGLKADWVRFAGVCLPIIAGVLDDQEIRTFLLEDVLELWSSAVAQSPNAALWVDKDSYATLTNLAKNLTPLMSMGSDMLRKVLEIAEQYVLLAPEHMLGDSLRQPLFAALAELIGGLKPDMNGTVIHLVEVFARAAEGLGRTKGLTVVVGDMVTTGLWHKLLDGLRGSWEAHQTTGPNKFDISVDGVVETDYFSVLARVCLCSPEIFLQAVDAVRQHLRSGNASIEETMKWLLEEWFDHVDNTGDPGRRKLFCMALTKLLETNQSWILIKLQDLMTMWTDVITELTEGNDDKSTDSLVYKPLEDIPVHESPEEKRRRQLTYSDPVHTVNLTEFVRHHVHQAIQATGGLESFQNEWLVNVDKDVVKAFGELGIV